MANAEVHTPYRSEAEIVADVVAVLLRAGVIPGRSEALAAACRQAAIPVPLVQLRFDRMGRNGYAYEAPSDSPRLQLVVDDRPLPIPSAPVDLERELADARAGLVEANRDVADLTETLEVVRAERDRVVEQLDRLRGERPARTAKATATRKARRGNERVNPKTGVTERQCSKCQEWFPATAKHFYVKRPDTGALTSMCHDCRRAYQRDRYFTVSKQKALNEVGVEFGLSCTDCGRPLEVGDRVAGHSALHHVECPAAELCSG